MPTPRHDGQLLEMELQLSSLPLPAPSAPCTAARCCAGHDGRLGDEKQHEAAGVSKSSSSYASVLLVLMLPGLAGPHVGGGTASLAAALLCSCSVAAAEPKHRLLLLLLRYTSLQRRQSMPLPLRLLPLHLLLALLLPLLLSTVLLPPLWRTTISPSSCSNPRSSSSCITRRQLPGSGVLPKPLPSAAAGCTPVLCSDCASRAAAVREHCRLACSCSLQPLATAAAGASRSAGAAAAVAAAGWLNVLDSAAPRPDTADATTVLIATRLTSSHTRTAADDMPDGAGGCGGCC